MTGDHLPDADHVARYCKPKSLDEAGLPTAASFLLQLAKPEHELSVKWIEHISLGGIQDIVAIQAAFRSTLRVAATARLAFLNVGETKSYVSREHPGGPPIEIKHDPITGPAPDPSHSIICNCEEEPDLYADLLAQCVMTHHSAA